jgi:hypothetical protein
MSAAFTFWPESIGSSRQYRQDVACLALVLRNVTSNSPHHDDAIVYRIAAALRVSGSSATKGEVPGQIRTVASQRVSRLTHEIVPNADRACHDCEE